MRNHDAALDGKMGKLRSSIRSVSFRLQAHLDIERLRQSEEQTLVLT